VCDALATVAPAADCQQLGTIANAAAKPAMDAFQDADAAYDLQTEHGVRQGARLL
jgi:predicted secreted Zn-dependent protease